jgi:hypothetical protein
MQSSSITNRNLCEFESNLAKSRAQLLAHPLYTKLHNLPAVRTFMQYHVFAVWDFMSLLKTLQLKLTSVGVPWFPAQTPLLTRFINEIVLAEESDEVSEGIYLSHFELYLQAMHEVGANTTPIHEFIKRAQQAPDISAFLLGLSPEGGVFAFLCTTFQVIARESHEVAAAFLYGREDIIPEMFARILKELDLYYANEFRFFRHYLERHIQLDGDHHGPLARKMLIAFVVRAGKDGSRLNGPQPNLSPREFNYGTTSPRNCPWPIWRKANFSRVLK